MLLIPITIAGAQSPECQSKSGNEDLSRLAKGANSASSRTEQYISGHEYVDLGLPSGLLWATCNVGATTPADWGNYYAWGEVLPKPVYTHDNSLFYNKALDFLQSNGIVDAIGNLTNACDAARLLWGGPWRIPTMEEMVELNNLCTWEWATINSVNGYKVTGPNGNCIFLPATGWYNSASSGELDCQNERSEYWSSTVKSYGGDESARCLFFMNGDRHWVGTGHEVQRSRGLTIRPVCEKP